jgi:hypothetical protein
MYMRHPGVLLDPIVCSYQALLPQVLVESASPRASRRTSSGLNRPFVCGSLFLTSVAKFVIAKIMP